MAAALPDATIYAIDISPGMLARGRQLARQKGLSHIFFLRGDIYHLPFDDNSLDWIHCGGALHLFSHLKPVWKEVFRVLTPRGQFSAMTVAMARGGIGRIQRHMMARGKATFFRPEQLGADLESAGFVSFRFSLHRNTLLFAALKKGGQDVS